MQYLDYYVSRYEIILIILYSQCMFSATINIRRSSFGFSNTAEPSFIYQVNQVRFKVYLLWADL